MTRRYDVKFQRPSGVIFTLRTDGNTRRTAERRARMSLRSRGEPDVRRLATMSVEFVRDSQSDRAK